MVVTNIHFRKEFLTYDVGELRSTQSVPSTNDQACLFPTTIKYIDFKNKETKP